MIQKFNKIEESDKPLWELHPDEKYFKRVKEFFLMIEKLSDRQVKKGIQKFSSFSEREKTS